MRADGCSGAVRVLSSELRTRLDDFGISTMSKQAPKQKTLEFFLQKPKQTSSKSNTASKATPTAKPAPSAVKSASSGADSISRDTNTHYSAKKISKNTTNDTVVRGGERNVAESSSNDRSSSPLAPLAFSSSRSIASDAISNASSASRETPPTSEIVDLDMEDEDEPVFRPVS